MKNNFKLAAMFVAFCVFAGNAAICFGQGGRIAGGYGAVAKNDRSDAAAAANFAVQTQAKKDASLKLVLIERAERQIVAGSNYRLCLTVRSKNKPQEATAIVYRNLQGKFSLTSWTAGKCAGAANDETSDTDATSADEPVSYKGALEVGRTDSTILYVGAESGDYAAFCFANNSAVGRAVLAACKNGAQCEFVGTIDFESACKVKNLEADLSASGRITKIDSVKSFAVKSSRGAVKTAIFSTAAAAPDEIVKNLYAAKGASSPFFQKKSRALIDKYFTRELADTIWKDATTAGDGVGALDFNPLYYAQDDQITNFVIGKADANGTVKVKFKNFGKDEEIVYTLVKENTASKVWKIQSIMYSDAEDLASILEYGTMTEDEMKAADSENKLDGEYLVGSVKCEITTNKSGYWARVKCDDQENFQVIDTESMTFGIFNPNEKGRRGKFVFNESKSGGKFIDAAGKELKVKRIK